MKYCVCGHLKNKHRTEAAGFSILPSLGNHWCDGCFVSGKESFHTFKLDNLQYIEDLARERKLI